MQLQELVWTLVVLLDLGTADLVMAFYMLELCARAQRGLFKPNALRPLLIGCCVIARKLNTDARRVGDERGPRMRVGPAWASVWAFWAEATAQIRGHKILMLTENRCAPRRTTSTCGGASRAWG